MSFRFLTVHRRLWLPVLVALGLGFTDRAPAQTVATQPLSDIAAAAETHARSSLQDQNLADAEVKAGALDGRLRLKACELPLETFSNDNELRGGRMTIGVRCSGASPWTLYVPVAVLAQTSIVMIEGPLPRGMILNAAHLRLESRPLTALPPQYMTSTDQVLGRELTRAVSGTTVATANIVQARDLIAKGQDVTILATGANIQVRMAGVAMQKGQQGERIDVQNSSSGRTVQAVIVDSGTVQIEL
jgi:flagella basal body P-ring formation protein FlgA